MVSRVREGGGVSGVGGWSVYIFGSVSGWLCWWFLVRGVFVCECVRYMLVVLVSCQWFLLGRLNCKLLHTHSLTLRVFGHRILYTLTTTHYYSTRARNKTSSGREHQNAESRRHSDVLYRADHACAF